MVAGHTKFSPDLCFGLIKRKFRHATHVECVEEMAEVVEASAPVAMTNISNLAGNEDGQQHVPTYDWRTFFEDGQPIPQIRSQHFFKITRYV